MKAIRYDEYGDADQLYVQSGPAPAPAEDEALVRIKAFSINELDWKLRNGDLKIASGIPHETGIGSDLAGVIEQVRPNTFQFQPGDAVIGWLPMSDQGAYATHAVVKLKHLIRKPESMSFEEASCLPMVGATAWQAMREEARLQPGQRVLINGCTGAVGHYAVQIAKHLGAHVTGTCSTAHVEDALTLGCDEVIDYRQADIRESGKTFDVILDTSKQLPFSEAKPLMAAPSVYLDPQPGLGALMGSFLNNIFSEKKRDVLSVEVRQEDLQYLTEMVERGLLQTRVGRVYDWVAAIEAVRTHEAGTAHVVGKLVVRVTDADLK